MGNRKSICFENSVFETEWHFQGKGQPQVFEEQWRPQHGADISIGS